MLSAIAATTLNRVIGTRGKLPWCLPRETQYFRELIKPYTVIAGGRTWRSIPKPLVTKESWILTRQNLANYASPNARIFHDSATLITALKESKRQFMVIGGGEIYQLLWPWISELYLTVILAQPPGDTFLSTLNHFKPKLISGPQQASGLVYYFTYWQRIKV